MEKARFRDPPPYFERHHVIPRCMGGNDSAHNIVRLTAEEHFVAHQLLVKMFPHESKLAFAANMMTKDAYGTRNNKQYGWLKRKLSAALSERFKGKSLSDEHRKKLSDAAKGRAKSPSHAANLSRALKGNGRGRKLSDETKRRISESKKLAYIARSQKLFPCLNQP